MADENYLLGMYAALYYGEKGSTSPGSMEIAGNVKDLDVDMSAGEADISTRDNDGFAAKAPTLKECTCTFQMLWRPGDAFFKAVKNAWKTSGTIALAILTEKIDSDTAEGPIGDFAITNFKMPQNLQEAIIVDVTATLSKFRLWYPEI